MSFLSSYVIRSNATAQNSTTVGWVNSSTDRGTIDILWSCSITILLCCWVATQPNPGAATDKWYHTFVDKVHLTMIGLLGPEFLFGIALGQLSSARRCVKTAICFMELNGHTHMLFFVNMGGIHLTSPDFPGGFPITGQQLHYLLQHDHVDFPDMKAMAVGERNTRDTLSKLVTVWQVLFFSITELQRIRKGLSTTTIEITALSYAAAMIATSVCWFKKPSITKPQTITTKNGKLVYQIRTEAQEQTHPDLKLEVWYRTPMEFVTDDIWGIDTHWSYYTQLTHYMRFLVVSRPLNTRPWNRLPSDQWLPPDNILLPFGALVHAVFNVSFVIPWNFHFPTNAERWLWRGFSIYQLVFAAYGGVYYIIEVIRWQKLMSMNRNGDNLEDPTLDNDRSAQARTYLPPMSGDLNSESHLSGQGLIDPTPNRGEFRWYWKIQRWLNSARNISRDMDPRMEMSLRVLGPVSVTCALYIIARLFLYIEDFASLRAQPADTYQTVNRFIPFLGSG
ncbi:hypothetical protein F5Y08DRAFT_328217 [Xylaria arbuscula]|nr:hypothetical protein F5Y08DRAFT_328217 [Xylaria arbuscula]